MSKKKRAQAPPPSTLPRNHRHKMRLAHNDDEGRQRVRALIHWPEPISHKEAASLPRSDDDRCPTCDARGWPLPSASTKLAVYRCATDHGGAVFRFTRLRRN